jgi:hypothetical protein
MIDCQQAGPGISDRQEISSRCTLFQALLRKVWFSLSAFRLGAEPFFNFIRVRTSCCMDGSAVSFYLNSALC